MKNKIIMELDRQPSKMHINVEADEKISIDDAASIMHFGISELIENGVPLNNIIFTILDEFSLGGKGKSYYVVTERNGVENEG